MASKGNCYLCGAELGKVAMKNHILKYHSGSSEEQECRLLKIEGAYDKDYWLYVDIPVDKGLSTLDRFLLSGVPSACPSEHRSLHRPRRWFL